MKGLLVCFIVAVALGQLVMEEEGVFKEQQAVWNLPKKSTHAITVSVGTEVTIDLPSNPTTGFQWKWMNSKLLGRKLKSLNKKDTGVYVRPESKLMGASGRQTFTFEAPVAGKDTLVFGYKRPWLRVASNEYIVTVNVVDPDL